MSRERIEAILEAWHAHDVDRLLTFFRPDVVWHDLGMPNPPANGRSEVRSFCETVLRAFPDLRYELRGPICISEDRQSCVIPWTISATNTGAFDPPGFAPTGKALRVSGLDYITFQDGLVTTIETRFDPVEPLEQILDLQIRPRPDSWLERLAVRIQRLRASTLRRRDKGRNSNR